MDKGAINTALNRSISSLLGSRKNRTVNHRLGGQDIRELIRDFKSFARDVNNYLEYADANKEQNNVPSIKQFLLALSTKDFDVYNWPNNKAKLAFRMVSELPRVGVESSMSEGAKFKINEARVLIRENDLSNEVGEYLSKINHDYLLEAWKIIQAKVSVDCLKASYSDDLEVRSAELKIADQSKAALISIEGLMSSPKNFDIDGLMNHLSSLQSSFEKYATLDLASEPFDISSGGGGDIPDDLKDSIKKAYLWSLKSDKLTEIADKTKGLPGFAFYDYQAILLGAYGYSSEKFSDKLELAKLATEVLFDSYVSDKELNSSAHQILKDIHSGISEYILQKPKLAKKQKVFPFTLSM